MRLPTARPSLLLSYPSYFAALAPRRARARRGSSPNRTPARTSTCSPARSAAGRSARRRTQGARLHRRSAAAVRLRRPRAGGGRAARAELGLHRARLQHHRRRARRRSRSDRARLALRFVPCRAGSGRRRARRGGVARGRAGAGGARRSQLVADGAPHRWRRGRADGRGRARHRPRSHEPAAGVPQYRAIGSAGAPLLFETGPGNGWLVGPWARHAPNPRGASFGIEIYRRLPNDTDFSILKRQGIPGLNFAPIGDSYAYHTARDTPERLSPRTIRDTGENSRRGADGARRHRHHAAVRPQLGTFFDIGGRRRPSYGPGRRAGCSRSRRWCSASSRGCASTAAAVRLRGSLRWLLTVVWSLLGVGRGRRRRWSAPRGRCARRGRSITLVREPGRLFLLLLAVGVTVGWGDRAARPVAAAARAWRCAIRSIAWSLTLPVWIALGGGDVLSGAGRGIPVDAAALCRRSAPGVPAAASIAVVRLASGVVLVVAAALWLRDTTSLLRFIVATLGPPADRDAGFVYAAVMTGWPASCSCRRCSRPSTPTRPLLRPSIVTALLPAGGRRDGRRSPIWRRPTPTTQPLRRVVRARAGRRRGGASGRSARSSRASISARARRRAGRRRRRRRRRRSRAAACRTRSFSARPDRASGRRRRSSAR